MAFFRFQCFHNLFSQGKSALAAFGPDLGKGKCTAPLLTEFLNEFVFGFGIGYERISSNHHRNPVFLQVLDMLFQIDNSLFQRLAIFLGELVLGHAAVIL